MLSKCDLGLMNDVVVFRTLRESTTAQEVAEFLELQPHKAINRALVASNECDVPEILVMIDAGFARNREFAVVASNIRLCASARLIAEEMFNLTEKNYREVVKFYTRTRRK